MIKTKTKSLIDQILGLDYYVTPGTTIDREKIVFRKSYEDFTVIELVDNKISVNSELLMDKISKGKGKYLAIVLTKRGLSTHEAIGILSRSLGVKSNKILYLGLKDANAVTTQLLFIKDAYINSINTNNVKNPNIEIKILGYINKLPKLWGNNFKIKFKVTKDVEESIEEVLFYLRQNPYLPAYYGYQRFGTRRPITHVIGELMLREEWCTALEYVVKYPFLTEHSKSIITRLNGFKLHDHYRRLGLYYEYKVIKYLREGGNCLHVLRTLGLRMLSLFISAYQSYIFNKKLSLMLERVSSLKDLNGKYIIVKPCIYNPLDFNDCIRRPRNTLYAVTKLKRPALMKIYDLTWLKRRVNDFVEYNVTFSLRKGMYATVVLREIFKTSAEILSG